MNKIRRKSLLEIIDKLEDLNITLEYLKQEEEQYRDNMPENLQGSERYQQSDEACDNMDDAITSLEDAINAIEAAIE